MADLRQPLHVPIRRIPHDRLLLHGLLRQQRGHPNRRPEDRLDGTGLVGPARRNASRRRIVHQFRRCDPDVNGCDEWNPIVPVPCRCGRLALLRERLPGERERDAHRRVLRDGRRGQPRDRQEIRCPNQRLIVRASRHGVAGDRDGGHERVVHFLRERHADRDESERDPVFTMYSVDGAGWTQYAQRFMLPEGSHSLDYQSWDSAGFVEPRATTSIDVDLTPPTLGGSPSGVQTTPDVTITWTASDTASGVARYEVSIDGGPTESVGMTTSLSRRWSDGDHTIRVTAYDTAGNQDATVINFRVSPGSPSVFGVFQTLPLVLPAIALGLLLFAIAFWHRRLRRHEDEDRGDSYDPDEYPEEYDSSDL